MPSPFLFRRVLAAEQSRPRLAQGRQGFALLITIVLMAFLVLIVVSMASLTRVETQIAANYQQLDSARQNALMALNIAVGQLQASAGPDQRVTARAEILDSTPATATVDSVKQPYWTGVWRTGKDPLDVVISGVNTAEQRKTSLGSTDATLVGDPAVIAAKATWLVSQPTPTTTIDPLTGNVNATTSLTVLDSLTEPSLSAAAAISGVTTDSVAPNAVILAKKIGRKDPSALPSDTTNPGFIVAAPLVTLTGNVAGFNSARPIGKYAYWVADEGVKAKVNLVDPTLGVSASAAATATTAQAHFLAPQANALHKVAGLVTSGVTDFRLDNTAAQVTKVIAPNSLAFLPTTPAGLNIKPYLTDITTYSRGVLADVKNGGLKKDLTAAFESTAGYDKLTGVAPGSPDYGYGQKMLYRNYNGLTQPFCAEANAAAYAGRTDGLPWAALYTYYNTYKSALVVPSGLTTSGGPITPTTTGSLTSLPYQMTPRVLNIRAATGNTKYGGLVPEVISFRMDIALGSYLQNEALPVSATNPYKLRLLYYPQLVLYNPYNCRLNTSGFDVRKDLRIFYNRDKADPYRITVTVGGTQVATDIVLNPMFDCAFSLGNSSAAGSTATLEPGETRVFGLVDDIQMFDAVDPTKPSLAKAITCTTLTSTGSISADCAQWTDLPVSVTPGSSTVVVGTTTYTTSYTNGAAYAGTDTAGALVTVSPSSATGLISKFRSDSGYTFISKTCLWPNVDNTNRTVNTSGTDLSYSPRASDWASLPISSLTNPRMLAGFFFRKKGLVTSSPSASFQNGTVVIPSFHGNAPGFSIFDNRHSNTWGDFTYGRFGSSFTSSTEILQIPVTLSGPWETHFGSESVGKGSGTAARKVLRDVPGQPMLSLGQFMHMPIVVTSNENSSPLTSNRFNYGTRDNGSMFIGGSLCNPFIPTGATLAEWPGATVKSLYLDDSYLANDTLFDRFYFSTVPPAPAALDINAPSQWTSFTSLSDPFANARIQPYARNGVAPTLADLRDFDQAAANLLLDGAFNVNSTSIDAWKALLSSLSGNELQVFNSVSGTAGTISASALKNPIPRFWASAATGAVNQPWEGARALSDAEVTELATRIVEQVKMRGPFLSMSDFLNRRLGTASAMTRVGALQAAIDNSSLNDAIKLVGATVNPSGFGLISETPSVITANLIDGKGNTLNSTVGMPGYLMQQDVVQAFSAAMTVRSDTFTIRTYGETINPATGVTQAKAWAEAVVQRLPEFVDPSTTTGDSDPTTAIESLSSTTNQNMGRRFKVIGFRWLSPSDL